MFKPDPYLMSTPGRLITGEALPKGSFTAVREGTPCQDLLQFSPAVNLCLDLKLGLGGSDVVQSHESCAFNPTSFSYSCINKTQKPETHSTNSVKIRARSKNKHFLQL